MTEHDKINYIELPAKNIDATQAFFSTVFGWSFEDYGPEYCCVAEQGGIDLGFYLSTKSASTDNGSALVIFYSKALKQTMDKITDAGGTIVKETFEFPGGRRFHFADPNGNEFAVWSDVADKQNI